MHLAPLRPHRYDSEVLNGINFEPVAPLKRKSTMNYLLIPVGVIARLLPHIPNFTPIGGMALFGAAHGSRRSAFIAPLVALAVSDFFIGHHVTMPFVYASFILIAMAGRGLFRNGVTTTRVVAGSLASSMILFVVSNFGEWAMGTLYAPTLQGLVLCYTMALPYLFNTMAGDLFYAGVFFGGYALANHCGRITAQATP
ncbi:MAG: hypothetical protein CL475_02420 [Acidobacteria bacterium]|nr:hypothetical protein [Acidobacteriota bacterium]